MSKSPINTYRTELMGIGAIGILCVHSCQVIEWPSLIWKVFSYGGVGVYLFMFLSGIGLYYSLNKEYCLNGMISVRDYYVRRIKRVLIPYILVGGVWYGLKYLIVETNVLTFLYELSTLSFWLDHQGAWYVALLIPLYAIYPVYFKWVESKNRRQKSFAAIATIIVVQVILNWVSVTIYGHLAQVLHSLWVFSLGHYMAPILGEKQKNVWILLVPFAFLFVITRFKFINELLPAVGIFYAYTGIVLTIVVAYFLSSLNLKVFDYMKCALRFCGKVSLELYLTNIFLIHSLDVFSWGSVIENPYVVYSLIVVAGILMSIVFSQASLIVVKRLRL